MQWQNREVIHKNTSTGILSQWVKLAISTLHSWYAKARVHSHLRSDDNSTSCSNFLPSDDVTISWDCPESEARKEIGELRNCSWFPVSQVPAETTVMRTFTPGYRLRSAARVLQKLAPGTRSKSKQLTRSHLVFNDRSTPILRLSSI